MELTEVFSLFQPSQSDMAEKPINTSVQTPGNEDPVECLFCISLCIMYFNKQFQVIDSKLIQVGTAKETRKWTNLTIG